MRRYLAALAGWARACAWRWRMSAWRRRLAAGPFASDSGNLVFFALLGGLVLLLAGMTLMVYADHQRSEWHRQRQADLTCLARNVYHEARGEPFAGQVAVAEVTLNRVASRRFPDNICDVVYEKRFDVRRSRLVGAFSWTELEALERPRGFAWRTARKAAEVAYDRTEDATVPGALFYHADRMRPDWAAEKKQVAHIGRHIFYE